MFGFKNQEIRELRAELREAREKATAAERRRCNTYVDQLHRDHAAQCLRLANDVEKWQRKAKDLEAGARRVADQNKALRERVEDLRDGSGLLALDAGYEHLDQLHQRAKRRIVRYVTELRQLRLRVTSQQRQLDDALGMNDDPDIAAGAGWQARRPDKAPEAKRRTAASPSGPLPRREPGAVDAR